MDTAVPVVPNRARTLDIDHPVRDARHASNRADISILESDSTDTGVIPDGVCDAGLTNRRAKRPNYIPNSFDLTIYSLREHVVRTIDR